LRRGRVVLAVALAAVAAGCGGSGGDKAGGGETTSAKPVGKPVTLRLLAVDALWSSEYEAAVARLSGGTIRIETTYSGGALLDYERRLVEKVRTGETDLASVGARAWDRLGVTSLRAVVAPFLVDNFELERRVVESPAARRMLEGVRPLGLVGLALLPGPMRRPVGLRRRLVGAQDYAGSTFGLRYGGVARDALLALDAPPKPYRMGALGGLDGAELDLRTIESRGYAVSNLTGNVVLWARPETIVIGRRAFDRLSPAQREVLRRAGREAVGPVLARLEREQQDALETICDRGSVVVAAATDSEVAALRAAVQPVYDELERDPDTKRAIAEIRQLRTGQSAGVDAVGCPSGPAVASELEGVWQATVTPAEIRANGGTAAEASTFAGAGTLELHDGRWTFRNDRTTVKGTYRAGDDALSLTMRTCTANPCDPGMVTDYGWSVYRDRLSLTMRPGHLYWPRLVAKPARRVG
jgi:TRAP-type C4-dicarboxylate transport system substrate-binding protein